MRIPQSVTVMGLSLVLSACATQGAHAGEDLSAAVKSLANQTEALKTVAKTEADAKVTVRRDEAIRYWISHGDDTKGVNLTSSNPGDSFAHYVCAGSGALESVNAATTYMAAYSSAAQAAVDPGPDTFSGQFAKFLDQNSPAKTVALPPETTKASQIFADCVSRIAPLLELYNRGTPASDTADEFAVALIPAAIAAGQKLISSLETLAKDGLKLLNAAQQRKHLRAFMSANAVDLKQVEDALQANNKLDDAWARRQAFVLGSGYEKFVLIMGDKNRAADAAKLRAAGLEVSTLLAPYDSMAATKKPSEVVKAWVAAQAAFMKDVNDDSISIAGIIGYLQTAEAQLSAIQSDYKDSSTKFATLVQSLKAVSK